MTKIDRMESTEITQNPLELKSDTRNSFRRAFLQTLTGNLLIQSIGVATGILTARLLGPTGRGELSTVLYYPTVVSQVGSNGIQQATAFEVSRRPHEEAKILKAGLSVALLLGVT